MLSRNAFKEVLLFGSRKNVQLLRICLNLDEKMVCKRNAGSGRAPVKLFGLDGTNEKDDKNWVHDYVKNRTKKKTRCRL